jgi:hypothetical protein
VSRAADNHTRRQRAGEQFVLDQFTCAANSTIHRGGVATSRSFDQIGRFALASRELLLFAARGISKQ